MESPTSECCTARNCAWACILQTRQCYLFVLQLMAEQLTKSESARLGPGTDVLVTQLLYGHLKLNRV